MCDHDESLVGSLAEMGYDVAHKVASVGIETMEGLVEDEQGGIFDKGARQEAESLLTAGEGEEHAVAQVFDAENAHPEETGVDLLGSWALVEADGIVKAGGDDVDGGAVLLVGTVELGADETDVLLDLPDGLTGATSTAEEGDVAGIGRWMIGTDEAEQGALAGSIASLECPMVATMNGPVETIVESTGGLGELEGEVAEGDDLLVGGRR